MSRNLEDLRQECSENNLTVKQSGKRESKDDYIPVLRDFYWDRDHSGESMLPQYLPMLAHQTKGLDDEAVDLLWRTCAVQEKINGCRGLLHINPFRDGKNHLQSRRISDKTYRLNENTDNAPHLRDAKGLVNLTDTVFDGELQSPQACIDTGDTVTKNVLQATVAMLNCSPEKSVAIQEKFGKLKYIVYDILFHNGKDVRNNAYISRHALLLKLQEDKENWPEGMTVLPLMISDTPVAEKKAYYEELVSRGCEGVMLKKLSGTYECDTRSKFLWKMKKFMEIDAFVTGGLPGEKGKGQEHLISALVFSAVDTDSGKVVEVASCSAFTIVEKEAWTETVNGVPSLKSEFLDMVYEIRGQEISGRNFRLTHATPEARRYDKSPKECTFSLSEWVRIQKEQN
jgi:ATP-dependent DNA ligase